MSGSLLKLIALVTMVIDHIGAHLVPRGPALFTFINTRVDLHYLLRSIGRVSFPLYAFLLAEGFAHTRDRRRYALRLFAFALISEIPWDLEHADRIWWPEGQNVFFTLFLGCLGCCIIEKLRTDWEKERVWILALAALAAAAHFGQVDHGLEGFGLILALYLLRGQVVPRDVVGILLSEAPLRGGVPAFLLIHCYNGTRGFIRNTVTKIAFYAVYPVHIFLIYLVKYNKL